MQVILLFFAIFLLSIVDKTELLWEIQVPYKISPLLLIKAEQHLLHCFYQTLNFCAVAPRNLLYF